MLCLEAVGNTCYACGGSLDGGRRKFCTNLCYWFAREGRQYRTSDGPIGSNQLADMRQEADDHGVPWCEVAEEAGLTYRAELESREHADAVRQAAWSFFTGADPAEAGRWATGFHHRFGKLVAEHDYTMIPKYDTIAQEVGWSFPEFQRDGGTARLWDLLLRPRPRLLPWVDRAKQTVGRLAAGAANPEPAFADPIPF